MHYPLHPLCFGEASAITCTSEANYLDALRRSNRPMRDASFKVKRNVATKASSITVGGITIAAGSGCPVHLETAQDPQYTLLVFSHGSGVLQQGRTTVRAAGPSILRASYHRHLTLDYAHYSGFTIRSSIPLLLKALKISDEHKERVTERLLDTDLEQVSPMVGGIDYHESIRSVLGMIDAAGCDESQLERIGFHRLLMGIVADLTLKIDKRLTDL